MSLLLLLALLAVAVALVLLGVVRDSVLEHRSRTAVAFRRVGYAFAELGIATEQAAAALRHMGDVLARTGDHR